MAVTTIAHKPGLTKEQAQELFHKHFEGRYQVEEFKGFLRDFTVVKNPFVGVAVKLEQTGSETKFVYGGTAPRLWARLLLGTLIGMFMWNSLTNEIKQYLETAPEFR